jgi:hypothetical protein
LLILSAEEGNNISVSPAAQKVLKYLEQAFNDARLLYQADVEVLQGLFSFFVVQIEWSFLSLQVLYRFPTRSS